MSKFLIIMLLHISHMKKDVYMRGRNTFHAVGAASSTVVASGVTEALGSPLNDTTMDPCKSSGDPVKTQRMWRQGFQRTVSRIMEWYWMVWLQKCSLTEVKERSRTISNHCCGKSLLLRKMGNVTSSFAIVHIHPW